MAGVRLTKDQQWKALVEGLAAACLAIGVERLPGAKLNCELSFGYAWRRWDCVREFPGVSPSDFFIYVRKSERRVGTLAAFAWTNELVPYLAEAVDWWGPRDVLEVLSERHAVSVDDWLDLASLFVDDLTKDRSGG